MRKVFEPDEIELWDIQGDPNQVLEIQSKVKELLQANRQRRPVLLDEIGDGGAWALPGVINATYVWMRELELPQAQTMVAKLMADLAGDNPAAIGLLFRAGVLNTPFPVPRAIGRRALDLLQWQPNSDQADALRTEIDLARRSGDAKTALDLYPLLFTLGDRRDLASAKSLCEAWARGKRAESGALLKLLVDHFPGEAGPIISGVLSATAQAYRDKNLAKALLKPLRPIPSDWLENGTILEISREVLPNVGAGRHTAVEYLWSDAVTDCQGEDPDRWRQLMPEVSQQVTQEGNDSIARYWYQATGGVGEIDYVVEHSQSQPDPCGLMAALQLFFLSRDHTRAKDGLLELQHVNLSRYEDASDMYERITGITKEEGDIERGRRAGQPTIRKD